MVSRRGVGSGAGDAIPTGCGDFAIHSPINGVDNFYIRLFPGVYTPADDLQLPDFGIGNSEHLGRFKLQLMGVVLRREGNIP